MNEEIEIKIESMGSSGEGVGRHDGIPYFVEGALPGERVTARIQRRQARYGKGDVDQILEPSPDRVKAPCPLFGRCGGCQLMHLSAAGQLASKRQKVVDALQRIGHLDASVEPCLPSPKELHYRNKIQLPIGPDGAPGLYARGSHQVVPIDECLIHCEQGESVYKAVRDALKQSDLIPYDEATGRGDLRHVMIRSAERTEESLIVLVGTGRNAHKFRKLAASLIEYPLIKGVVSCTNRQRSNTILSSDFTLLAGQATIEEQICGLTFEVSPRAFFQVNSEQAEKLYKIAIGFAELSGTERVVDAYCGVGTLTLIAASKSLTVVGIEVVPEAIEDAKKNAQRNSIENTSFVCETVEKALGQLESADVVFLNPPRKGCHQDVLEALLKHGPERIIYISCDPATLARDLRVLSQGYAIDRVQPLDMFPQTAHVETIVSLTKTGSPADPAHLRE